MNNKAIFLDWDGTIMEDWGYICDFSEVSIFPFAVDAICFMNENKFKVIVVINQSSIARGICFEDQVRDIHRQTQQFFLDRKAVIDDFYYCPYHVDGVIEKFKKKHECRKPSPGMFLQAAKDYDIDLSRSFLIGDNECDILAGQNAGCGAILVLIGKGKQARTELK
ncbi:D-glycero-alpha-D-manno-heptose-1,7-bisphosphate 7-phosphatase [Acidobacteriota bacterium]